MDWTERIRAVDAEVVATYAEGALAGLPAVTSRRVGAGRAWYVSADVHEGFDALVDTVVAASGVAARLPVVPGVEAVRRCANGTSWLFLINHGAVAADVPVTGVELLSGDRGGRRAHGRRRRGRGRP